MMIYKGKNNKVEITDKDAIDMEFERVAQMIVIFPPLVFHIFHCLIQRPEVLILVIAPGVLIVLILHTEIIRYNNDSVLEKKVILTKKRLFSP